MPERPRAATAALVPTLLLTAVLLGGCQRAFFFPEHEHYWDPAEAGLAYEDIRFTAADGTELHGWLLPAQTQEVRGTVVHFHGNAQNISTHVAAVWWLPRHGFRVFTFDYRGYGRSGGEPSFAGVHRDARAALETVTDRLAVQPGRLLILGQSLGASIAITALARWEGEEPAGIVAEGAFASYRGIAREKLGDLWLTWPFQHPLSWLVGDTYAPIDHVAELAPSPLLLIVDGDDRVIPPAHAERLYEAASEPRYLWRIEGARHSAALADDRVRHRLLQTFRGWLEGDPEAAARPPEGPWRKDPPRP